MSSSEEVCRLDPALRLAMEIAYQDGLEKEYGRDLYEKVCLGEITVNDMLDEIEAELKNPTLREALESLREGFENFIS